MKETPFTFSGPPNTQDHIVVHELAHAVAACIAMHKYSRQQYDQLTLHIDPQVSFGTTFGKDVSDFFKRKVNALSALCPNGPASVQDHRLLHQGEML